MAKQPCVYILASKRNGTLYTGVTSALFNRVGLHKQDLIEGFTKRYGVHRLVYYEMHRTTDAAILREKRVKKWNRAWKIRLIESMNPEWNDLFMSSGLRSKMGRLTSNATRRTGPRWRSDLGPRLRGDDARVCRKRSRSTNVIPA